MRKVPYQFNSNSYKSCNHHIIMACWKVLHIISSKCSEHCLTSNCWFWPGLCNVNDRSCNKLEQNYNSQNDMGASLFLQHSITVKYAHNVHWISFFFFFQTSQYGLVLGSHTQNVNTSESVTRTGPKCHFPFLSFNTGVSSWGGGGAKWAHAPCDSRAKTVKSACFGLIFI